jgi:transposase
MVFFSAGKGGGKLVDYGYKGKGVTIHLLVDGNGNPIGFEVTAANGDEKQQVEKLLSVIEEALQKRYKLNGLIPIFEADKGYDAEELRDKLLRRKIFPFIPYRRIGAAKKAQIIVCNLAKQRWKVERAIAWLQRKYRRLVVRWERRFCYWKGFLSLSLIFFWLCRFLG